jgi:hypothetical protein
MDSGLQPHRDLTPAACRSIVQALDLAETTFKDLGVRIPDQAALRKARQWLKELGQRDEIKLSARELKRTAEAAALAVDLYHISIALGDEPHPMVSADLSRVVRGAPFTTSSVQDFIAQFWVGTLLAQSGIKTTIEAFERPHEPRPDFIAEWGTVDFAVEVKCPKSGTGAQGALSKAAKQIRDQSRPGVAVLDLTYALDLDPTLVTTQRLRLRDQFRVAHNKLHVALAEHVENYRRSDKYSRVVLLVTFARFWSWNVDLSHPGGATAERDAGVVFSSTLFSSACQGLINRQAKGFQHALPRGIQQLMGNPPVIQSR